MNNTQFFFLAIAIGSLLLCGPRAESAPPKFRAAAIDVLDSGSITFEGSGTIIFEGSTADDFETTFIVTDSTDDRTVTFPDADVDLAVDGTGSFQSQHENLSAITTLTDTAYGRNFLEMPDAATTQSKLSLVPGTDVQTQSARLDELSGLSAAEIAQLTNIGSSTVSESQWGWLGGITEDWGTAGFIDTGKDSTDVPTNADARVLFSSIPSSRNLAPVARKIVNGFAKVQWLGDSTGSQTNSARVTQGVIAEWDVPWAGYGGPSSSSSPDEGWQTFSDPGNSEAFGDAILTDGSTAPYPVLAREITSGAATTFHRIILHSLDGYKNGPWVNGKNISFRLLIPDLDNPVTAGRIILLKDGVSSGNYNTQTFDGGSDFSQTWNLSGISAITGITEDIEVQFDQNVGGSAGRFYADGGGVFYDAAALAEKRGFYWLRNVSVGGWSTTDHLAETGDANASDSYEDADGKQIVQSRANQLIALGELATNIYFIQLGINTSTGENADTDAAEEVYKSNIEKIIGLTREIHTLANATDSDITTNPHFVLVAPWDTLNDDYSWEARQSRALDNIAADDNMVSTLQLGPIIRKSYGLWSEWKDTYLDDNTHQNAAGVDLFAKLMWIEILDAANQSYAAGEMQSDSVVTVSLTADDQVVTPKTITFLSSDDATAANRTATLAEGTYGQVYRLVWTGTNQGQFVDTTGYLLNGNWEPDSEGDNITLLYDGTQYIEVARSDP